VSKTPWWKGAHGEWYVVGQVLLFLLVVFGPRTLPGLPTWIYPYTLGTFVLGGLLIIAGGVLSLAGVLRLGANLTALPFPKDEATLVEAGPYRIVRHPIYSGLICAAFGWALVVEGWLTIGYAIMLLLFFDIKSRREERWLCDKFPGYDAYQKRVRKLIPWVY
jgi:protein-S-isoprenylcysteine O-methyltransferase Ste14